MSPGSVMTATPPRPTAWRIAEFTVRGDCAAEEMSSL